MNLERRISRLEQLHHPRDGRLVAMWALDDADLKQKTAKMRAAGEIGPHDTIVVTMWGMAGDRRM